MQKDYYGKAGFLLLEIMMALTIGAALILSCLAWIYSSQLQVIAATNHLAALNQSASALTELKMQDFGSATSSVWLADYAKAVASTATYFGGITNKRVELQNLLFKNESLDGRDTCSLYFSGDWQNPQIISQIFLDSGNPAAAVDKNGGLVYVAANGTTQSLSDLYIFDASDLKNPVLKSKLNTGPGLADVHFAKKYIFAANDGVADQLQIINVSDPNNPGPVIKIRVPNFNGQPSDGSGNSILFYGNRVYLGLTKNNGPELHVYDVSNPKFPYWLGAYETNSAINDIYVRDHKVYLAVAEGKQFLALDAEDPANIIELGSFLPPGNTSQSGQSIFGLGDRFFLGRAGGLPNLGYKELYFLNNSYQETSSLDLNATVRSLFYRDSFLFLATGQADKEFQIFNFSNGFGFVSSIDSASDASSLDCEADNFFVTTSGGALVIVGPTN